jgi:hypothetical protein
MMMAPSAVRKAFDRVAHDGVFQERDLAVEHADIDLGRFAGLETMDQRGVDGDRCEEARSDIADRHAYPRRRLALVASDAHDAAHALHDHVVCRILRIGTAMAEARG